MYRMIIPRVMHPESRMNRYWDQDMDSRSPWKLMDNMNRNVERMMEDAYNDMWSAHSGFKELASRFPSPADMVMSNDPSNFEMNLNVENYKPEEIDIKLDGRNLEIRAKHEERQDEHGYISREFSRRVLLPENVDLETLESTMGNNGWLAMKAKVKGIEAPEGPRRIEIKRKSAGAMGDDRH